MVHTSFHWYVVRMKVILIVDVKKVGSRGEVVTVADGYGMNVLIPQKKAVPATADNMKRHDAAVKEAQGKADQSVAIARELLNKIDGKSLTIAAKASPTGTLFKSIHASDIAAAVMKEWSITLPESAIMLEHSIKQKGTYSVPLTLLGSKAKLEVVI